MKFIEILQNVDKSEENTEAAYSNVFDWLQQYLGLDYGSLDADKLQNDNKLRAYWLSHWRCTDTKVGKVVIYFEGKPAAVLDKTARKSPAEVQFLSLELKKSIRVYLIELIFHEEPEEELQDIISEDQLNDTISPMYKINYVSQVQWHKEALLDGTKMVEVLHPSQQDHSYNNFYQILVRYSGQESQRVNINRLQFYANLQKVN